MINYLDNQANPSSGGTVTPSAPGGVCTQEVKTCSDGSKPARDAKTCVWAACPGETPVNTHTITATSTGHGSISPNGAVKVDKGTEKTFTFTPDSGYKIDSVLVNGVSATVTNNSYTIKNVTADYTITVSFVLTTQPPTVACAGVIAYPNPSYGGSGVCFTVGDFINVTANGMKNDDIESFKIESGYVVFAYKDGSFGGTQIVFDRNTPGLGSTWWDSISSLKVQANNYPVIVYSEANFIGGSGAALNVGEYNVTALRANKVPQYGVYSIIVKPGYKVTMYEGDFFTGRSIEVTQTQTVLQDSFGGYTQSLKIVKL
jgi:hypothetical protein